MAGGPLGRNASLVLTAIVANAAARSNDHAIVMVKSRNVVAAIGTAFRNMTT
jgi:hypothetical protein